MSLTTWQDWLKERENLQVENIDYDGLLQNIIKLLMSRYRDETMEFLKNMASRGDEELNTLLNQLGIVTNNNQLNPVQMPQDEVVPSSADVGLGMIG